MENWKSIRGYEGLYLVSDQGRVMNATNGHVLCGCSNGVGYKKVELWKNNIGRRQYLHRIVASAFIDNPLGKAEVNHKDGDRSNNCAGNLEWVTSSENTKHAVYSKALKPWNNAAKPIKARNIKTGEERLYATISEAERDIGSRHITDALKGKRFQCKGYTFSYLEGGDADAGFDYAETKQ